MFSKFLQLDSQMNKIRGLKFISMRVLLVVQRVVLVLQTKDSYKFSRILMKIDEKFCICQVNKIYK